LEKIKEPKTMEIVLESLCEWIAKRFEKHSALKLFLLLLIFLFGCWMTYIEWVSWFAI